MLWQYGSFLDCSVCVCVLVISVSLLQSAMLPGLESLREDLEASQPDKVVYTPFKTHTRFVKIHDAVGFVL